MIRLRRSLGWAPLLILLVLTACSSAIPDEQAQEQVLADYLAAVQAGDRDRIAQLCQPGVDASADIAAVVKRIGGRQWHDVEISWHRGEFPNHARAEVVAVDAASQRVAEMVVLTKVDGKWWIGLGSASPDRDRPPAGTSRPG